MMINKRFIEMNSKIVYAFVTNDLSYDQRMNRTCTALQAQKYAVTLLGRKLPQSIPLAENRYVQKRLNCFFKKGMAFYLEYNLRLILYMLPKKVDIIHAADLDTLGAATVVKLFKNCKLVFDAHEYFTEVPELEGKRLKKSIWSRLGKLCAPFVDAAITVSEPLQEILKNKYGLNFSLVRNFPTMDSAPVNTTIIKSRENVILYQGAVNDGRGVGEMIRLMPRIPQWQLWIAGEGDLYAECKQLVADLGLAQQVKFYGYVKPEELKSITPRAKVGINLLSGDSENYLYSSANKFFDYIRASVPCITMDFVVYRKVVAQYKVAELLSDLSEDNIIKALNNLDRNYPSYVAACEKARDIYTWENELITLYRIYDAL